MYDPETHKGVLGAVEAHTGSGSGFADLAPEIQNDMYRRLGGVALVYAAAWIANFLYFNLLPLETGFPDRRMFFYVSTALCSLLGIAVYWGCRTRRIPPRHFANFAVVFEVMAGFGIMAGLFGWEHHGEQFIIRIAGALGFDGGASEVVSRLRSEGMRVIYSDGVSWVSVWLLVFPLIVPAPLGRTVVATLLTASTIPAVALLSLAVNGIPPAVRPWLLPYALELIVPTYICAGIAIFGSRVVYKLTRDLSKARQMGSYQLLEKIGAGGMGEVWKAKHQMLVRPAAIKFIRPEALGADNVASRTALRRFEREAQATSGLASPHSIDLYDFGVTDDGTFYFVMELLEGVDLKKLIEQFGPMPAERAVHILRQACHSLADAHSQGIVHRDIKPGNIFVARSGLEYDFVKVLDFGLVKHLYATETDTAHLTIEGVASGTPGFMAPEIASDHRRVDARADLYALGCVAYWILTGKLVFEGESAMAILVRHVKDDPVPPSERTTVAIPAELDRLVLQCLRKNPDERPQSARELGVALAACAKTLPAWTEERAAAWWQANLPQFYQAPRDREVPV